MEYIISPNQVESQEIFNKDFILSPSNLKKIELKCNNLISLRELLSNKPKKGDEVGSFAYISKSNKYFIRTKALSEYFMTFYTKSSEAIIPINPLYFKQQKLKVGNIIISKDSNIGEVVYLAEEKYCNNYMLSGGLVKLEIEKDREYIFAILKSKFFKEQLLSKVPRGATIKHAKDLYLDCFIPFPKDSKIKNLISNYIKEIIENELKILENYNLIQEIIKEELKNNQDKKFNYIYPSIDNINNSFRLNASIYSKTYYEEVAKVENYKNGFSSFEELGLKNKRGSSLEIKGLGTRLDSKLFKKGFYKIITPTNITEFGTYEDENYIGTKKELEKIKKGDIIFGGEGTRRLFIVCEEQDNTVTNYHGIRIFQEKPNFTETIFVWAFLSYWKDRNILDIIAVGGQGGHLAPEYFNYFKIPNFPQDVKLKIKELYFCNDKKKSIFQLDKRNKELKSIIENFIHKIIDDKV